MSLHARLISIIWSRIAGHYATRSTFPTELSLDDPPEATSAEARPPHLDQDYFGLSTIHSAKGQEWGAVFVLNSVGVCLAKAGQSHLCDPNASL